MATDPFSPANQPNLVRELGVYSLPYASTWPVLRDILARIYRERAGAIDWLPPNWLTRVMLMHGQKDGQGNAVVLIPASAKVTPAISFLDTPAKRAWWDEFSMRANDAVVMYAAQKAAEGRVQLDKLYADTRFWDHAINLAQFLAAPVTAAGAVLRNPWKSFGVVAAVGAAVVYFLYVRPFLSSRKK